jgi:putative hydrolase of the HAD superfamily
MRLQGRKNLEKGQEMYVVIRSLYRSRFNLLRKKVRGCTMSSHSSNSFSVLLFDLDGTLYDADNGYVSHQRRNLFEYIYKTGIVPRPEDGSVDAAEAYWRPLFKQYNQSLRGLRSAGNEIDSEDYWAYCRNGTQDFFSADEALQSFLASLPKTQKKYIFTNCNEKQALECMDCLGITPYFEPTIYGAKFMNDVCKPEKAAFQMVLQDIGIDSASKEECSQVCFFEDSFKNLVTAHDMGMSTVFVQSEIHMREEGVSLSEEQKAYLSCIVNTLSDEDGKVIKDKFPKLYL